MRGRYLLGEGSYLLVRGKQVKGKQVRGAYLQVRRSSKGPVSVDEGPLSVGEALTQTGARICR